MCAEPREEFYHYMDAANVDLKGFTESFYHDVTAGHLEPVKETLRYLVHETDVWIEVTNLLIPGLNDSEAEIDAMMRWIVDELGPEVPVHFTAFHPDYRMLDRPPTPPTTLTGARRIALANGLHYAYTGNVHDEAGESTYCHACGQTLIGRDWFALTAWNLTEDGCCSRCGTACAGLFDAAPGRWGPRRQPVRLEDFAI
jgi:pyruvate formate lyase activating enzyme